MKNTSDYIVQVEQLSKQVSIPAGKLTILKNINLGIHRGESVAIVGVSGSGKSTLLGLLAGLDVPSSGRIILDNIDLGQLDEDGRARLRNRRVGFVFQSFQLLPSLTALENVMLPLELADDINPENSARHYLEDVGLSDRVNHYPNQLSGGEQQRVAVARAFAGNPAILFADEPTGNLDETTAGKIIELIFRLNTEHGTTLLLITHDHEIARRCDRRLTLAGGELIADETV
ncbi:MAG: ATP-binding cassette domain-containing protein [Gammaproteobacteria bacterium]|nr:ATP-binding cassette domain-containing protein [Gammaproteobacteria bacterium]NIO61673.1 ATP-binding cassette domain-containing protein [Gammaproteobacteria bacterium]NIQ18924.1 ATP-binding cassette domain-containing protein [Gammaproteobacteria bacterium]NIT04973.1 ATP-binding cassette domain-containing protein [Gammaproteobacteria bacterium]NIT40346.1 ATP-binding cassette domain-containing protein [Gammaproteobacteria bacterium]